MIIRSHKITTEDFATLVKQVGEASYDGNLTTMDLRSLYRDGTGIAAGRVIAHSSKGPGARRSWTGRRSTAACWHAFRDVFYAVYEIDPDAVIATAMATYRGLAGFEATYPGTGDRNVGSLVAPAFMPELCDCEH